MINWEEITYSSSQAQTDFEKLTPNNITEVQLQGEFGKLRKDLIEARDRVFDKGNLDAGVKGHEYEFSLYFGMELYEILNSYGLDNRSATNDDVWRYLNIKVIPDVAHSRWGLHEARFYRESRRLFSKTLWWYIHLSWAGNKEETLLRLEKNAEDTIVSLVERPGLGYNVALYRELMKQYATKTDTSRKTFRRVMVLNTAHVQSVSPELYEGGIPKYVEYLFSLIK